MPHRILAPTFKLIVYVQSLPKKRAMHQEIIKAIQYSQRLLEAAIGIVGSSHVKLTKDFARDPKIVALTILCRTISNFRSCLLLVQQEGVMEARALVRLIYENLLWIGALRARGAAFVADMLEDEAFNRHALGQLTLEMSARRGADVNGADALKLRNLVSELGKQFPRKRKLHAKTAAGAGVVDLAYVEYGRFSLDAVHCSITALGRHLSSERTDETTDLVVGVIPRTPPAEILSTVLHACRGIMGVAIGTNELLDFTTESHTLAALLDEFERNGWQRSDPRLGKGGALKDRDEGGYMLLTKHDYLEWAIRSRSLNQQCCLRLLKLFDEDPVFWKTKKASRAAQELAAIAFSLWRAAFLAEKTGKREAVFTHCRDFLARLIEDNAIAYPQDKNAREWTFNYYTRNASYSLEFLQEYWGENFPAYVKATRNAVERWDYCQTLLDQCVDHFDVLIKERKKVRDERQKVRTVRVKAKQRRRAVRDLTEQDRKRR